MSQRNRLPASPVALFHRTQAHHLEQLTDQEFWHYAEEIAASKANRKAMPGASPTAVHLECETVRGRIIVELASLYEIGTTPAHFTHLPASPSWMAGITAWHGEPIAVVDLAAFLAQCQADVQENRPLLIAKKQDITIGLYITMIGNSLELPPTQIQPLSEKSTSKLRHCAAAVHGQYQGALIVDIPVILTVIADQLQVNNFI